MNKLMSEAFTQINGMVASSKELYENNGLSDFNYPTDDKAFKSAMIQYATLMVCQMVELNQDEKKFVVDTVLEENGII